MKPNFQVLDIIRKTVIVEVDTEYIPETTQAFNQLYDQGAALVIVKNSAIKITEYSDEELAKMGLQRIKTLGQPE